MPQGSRNAKQRRPRSGPSASGAWFVVDSTNGSVLSSGNNQLDMYGLDFVPNRNPVPKPGILSLLGLALAGLFGLRRSRR
jgi:hypothetical protein